MSIELPTPQGEASVAPQAGAERPAVTYGAERTPVSRSVEVGTTERPSSQEAKTAAGGGYDTSAPQPVVANPTTDSSAQAASSTSIPSLDDVPVVAADEDLIEKQWVDSAKRIIKETRTDPYQQGEAISRLQADYLQKRYGKTLPDSGA